MLKCPYSDCTFPVREFLDWAGLAAHMRFVHRDQWRDSIDASLPEGVTRESLGTAKSHTWTKRTRAFVAKGQKKPPIHSKCKWCPYKTNHTPGLTNALSGQPSEERPGTLHNSLHGIGRVVPFKVGRPRKELKTSPAKLEQQKIWRANLSPQRLAKLRKNDTLRHRERARRLRGERVAEPAPAPLA